MNNETYIGIYGRKGSSRLMFTYLLSKTLDWMITSHVGEEPSIEYINQYSEWTNYIKENINFINQDACNSNVHVMSFADNLKYIISVMIGQDYSYLVDKNNKGKLYINMEDLSVKYFEKEIDDHYVKIEDFYTTVGKFSFKGIFDNNILLKFLECDLKQFSTYNQPYKFRIFYDIKNDEEFKFIKNKNGITINITNSEKYINKLYEYNISIIEGIENNLLGIWNLSKSIIKNKNTLCQIN